jgi:Zn-dependent protease/predicted transcriptional regulator
MTIRGIPIRLHVTFPLILILAAFHFGRDPSNRLMGAVFGIVVTLLLFACVVVHELAHSLVVRSFGVGVAEIVLLPIGGSANMEEVPERPHQELLMALAGPVASGLLGLGLAVVMVVTYSGIWRDLLVESLGVMNQGVGAEWRHVLPYLVVSNLFLAGFNLVPAFPMDGGRVLRAVLAMVLSYSRATAIAVAIGQILAWLLGLVGLLFGDVTLMAVALFVYVVGAVEGRLVRVRTALTGLTVQQAFSRQARALSPGDTLDQAVEATLASFQADFPICDGQELVGLLTRADVLVGLREKGSAVAVESVMRREFPTVSVDDDLFEVRKRMDQASLDALPVVAEEGFVGLLTRQDVDEVLRLVSARPGLLEP